MMYLLSHCGSTSSHCGVTLWCHQIIKSKSCFSVSNCILHVMASRLSQYDVTVFTLWHHSCNIMIHCCQIMSSGFIMRCQCDFNVSHMYFWFTVDTLCHCFYIMTSLFFIMTSQLHYVVTFITLWCHSCHIMTSQLSNL